MSKKEGYSRKGIFGNINHYDEKGKNADTGNQEKADEKTDKKADEKAE